MNRFLAASCVAAVAVSLLLAFTNATVRVFDSKPDTWYLNDRAVKTITAAGQFKTLQVNTWAEKSGPLNPFAVGQQTPKWFPGQTMDDRWDVKQIGPLQYAAVYDGINQPYVVNRLRALLLRSIINNVHELIVDLDTQFEASKQTQNSQYIEQYLNLKKAVFSRIASVFEVMERYNEKSTSQSAAAGAVTIISPNFVIVAQMGAVHVLSHRGMDAVELTVDQSRPSSPDQDIFGLGKCVEPGELELCQNTRVFGAPMRKVAHGNSPPTHIQTPFIKLYKRVWAPSLNDNDLVLGLTSHIDTNVEDINIPDDMTHASPSTQARPSLSSDDEESVIDEPDPEPLPAGSVPEIQPASTVAEAPQASSPPGYVDSAGLRAVLDLDTGLANGENNPDEVLQSYNDLNELKYLVIATHPVAKKLSARDVAKIVAQNFHLASARESASVKGVMSATVRQLVDASAVAERNPMSKFVGNFFSDVTVLFIPFVTDAEKYFD